MAIRKWAILIVTFSLVGLLSTSANIAYANSNNTSVSDSQNASIDYETLLLPYQKALDDFNSLHETSYGFMTDEQLTRHDMDRQEYLKTMVDTYTSMTIDEFNELLELAYKNDINNHSSSAETLPYYQIPSSNDIIEVDIPQNATVAPVPLNN